MKYMILIYGNREAWATLPGDGGQELFRAHAALQQELTASGELVSTNELDPDGSKIVRRRGGIPNVVDGPFTESKEIVAGYYIVDCVDMDRATEIAGRLAEGEFAPIEVRAIGRAG